MLINNDTIVDKDFLIEMISVAEKVNAGIVGSKIYYYGSKYKIWFNGGKFNEWTGRAVHVTKNDIGSDFSYCSFITGCCMLISRKTIETIE